MCPPDNNDSAMAEPGSAHVDSAQRDRGILEARARALAVPVERSAEAVTEVISFSLNGAGYGIEACHVCEVTRLNAIVPLPGLSMPFVGITNHHGTILPVIDLLPLFQRSQKTDVDKAGYLIVLGRQEAELGVITTTLGPVIDVAPRSMIAPETAEHTEHLLAMVPGLGILVDGGSLLTDPRFWVNAK